jgi:hypothetical protein
MVNDFVIQQMIVQYLLVASPEQRAGGQNRDKDRQIYFRVQKINKKVCIIKYSMTGTRCGIAHQ